MLKVENFKKCYGERLIVETPLLQLDRGIHWFKGANGSGKTTFFRSVAGMLPFEGEAWIDGYHIRQQPTDYRLRINYGEAEPSFPSFLSAYDLMKFVQKTKKGPDEQSDMLVERLNLGGFMKNSISTYSSGMLKKTSILLAFLGNPTYIILDEPLVTIDDASVQVVYELINECYTQGVSFLLSSHQDFRFEKLPISTVFRVDNKQINSF